MVTTISIAMNVIKMRIEIKDKIATKRIETMGMVIKTIKTFLKH